MKKPALSTTLRTLAAAPLPAVLIIAFTLKALLLFVVLPETSTHFAGRYSIGFSDDYDVLAHNIASGVGYRLEPTFGETMMREPGYPLFLAGVFKTIGYRIEAARLANLLLALGAVLMLSRFARRFSDDQAVPVVAALLFLFHPGILIAEARGGVELLFIFALLAFMLALHEAIDNDRLRDYFLAGLALGVVVLIRSTPLLLPIFVLVYLLITARSAEMRRRSLGNILILIVGTGLVMSPWIIRNYALVHELVPTASVKGVAAQEGQFTCERSGDGQSFQQLQNDAATARRAVATELGLTFRGVYYQYFKHPADELVFSKTLQDGVVARYRESPALFAKCVTRNLVNFWVLGKTSAVTYLNAILQLPLVILALSGVWALWRAGHASKAAITVILILYVVAVHAPVIAHARHSIPLVPFLAVFASVAAVAFFRTRIYRKRSTA